MKLSLLILFPAIFFLAVFFVATPAWSQAAAAVDPPAQASAPVSAAATPNTDVPVDQENQRKAKALLDQAIQALGGQAYLTIRNKELQGRGFSFHHGRPSGSGAVFWSFFEFPDKERVELTKERDIAQIFTGDKGFEVTYKGAHPVEEKDLTPYLRRRRFSLDTLLRNWVNDPKVALFYEGYAVAAEKPAIQVTLINGMDEAVTLYFDADTHLPLKKSFRWRDPVDKQPNLEEEIYDNYRPVQGIMTPYSLTRYFNGDMANQRFINSVTYNETLNQAMFDPHSGYDPNKAPSKPTGKH
jgi:hypothetical protein